MRSLSSVPQPINVNSNDEVKVMMQAVVMRMA
jgi:hypothetical protein